MPTVKQAHGFLGLPACTVELRHALALPRAQPQCKHPKGLPCQSHDCKAWPLLGTISQLQSVTEMQQLLSYRESWALAVLEGVDLAYIPSSVLVFVLFFQNTKDSIQVCHSDWWWWW